MAVVAACIHVATARSNATAFRIAGVATFLKSNGDGKASGGYDDTKDPAAVSDGSLAQVPNRCVPWCFKARVLRSRHSEVCCGSSYGEAMVVVRAV